ncbi:hypothetical protein ACVPOW_03485 [Staphylococcus aureus]
MNLLWVTVNGMAAHGGSHPDGETFFVFSDYLMKSVYVYHQLWD